MKSILLKHPKTYFGFRKDKMYYNGVLKTIFSFAFGNFRLLLS